MTKKELYPIVNHLIEMHSLKGENAFLHEFEKQILNQKIKFPYHEYIAQLLMEHFGFPKIIHISDKINSLGYEGSYVQNGKILQLHLKKDLRFSNNKAIEYIISGNVWYACDIISDRVFGHGLITDFNQQFALLKKYIEHKNDWVQRAPGIAVHVAVKKGLQQDQVVRLFDLMLLQIENKSYFVKKGCGWGIETILKFHPHLANKYRDAIFNNPKTNSWIRKKFEQGLAKSEIRKNKSVHKAG